MAITKGSVDQRHIGHPRSLDHDLQPEYQAARHLKASPEHLSYQETVTRPYRFEPKAWR
ncbi:DUF7848 domain-containing protein [Streptomyces sp. NPDC002920]